MIRRGNVRQTLKWLFWSIAESPENMQGTQSASSRQITARISPVRPVICLTIFVAGGTLQVSQGSQSDDCRPCMAETSGGAAGISFDQIRSNIFVRGCLSGKNATRQVWFIVDTGTEQ